MLELFARYQANPKESHLTTVKRMIYYINGTFDYGLWYSYDSSLVIVGYFDADWVENVEDRKNTSSACFLLVIVLWLGLVRNKTPYPYLLSKQSKLLLEAVVRNSYGWRKYLKTMELWTMCIHCDKFRAINTSKNHILHFRTKHIGIRHSFIRDLDQDNVISLELVPLNINW